MNLTRFLVLNAIIQQFNDGHETYLLVKREFFIKFGMYTSTILYISKLEHSYIEILFNY